MEIAFTNVSLLITEVTWVSILCPWSKDDIQSHKEKMGRFGCTKNKNLYMANKGNNQLKYKNIFNISDKQRANMYIDHLTSQ